MAKKKETIDAEIVVEKKGEEKQVEAKVENNLSTSIIMGIIGLILLLLPEESNKLIGYVIGGFLIAAGVLTFVKYSKNSQSMSTLSVASGILYGILGFIIVLKPLSVMKLATIIFGIYLIVNGALKVQSGYMLKSLTGSCWQGLFVSGVIITIFGLVLIINPFSGLIITKVAGAFLCIVAVYDMISKFLFSN